MKWITYLFEIFRFFCIFPWQRIFFLLLVWDSKYGVLISVPFQNAVPGFRVMQWNWTEKFFTDRSNRFVRHVTSVIKCRRTGFFFWSILYTAVTSQASGILGEIANRCMGEKKICKDSRSGDSKDSMKGKVVRYRVGKRNKLKIKEIEQKLSEN